MDFGGDEIRTQHLGAEEAGNEAKLIPKKGKRLEIRRRLYLRFQKWSRGLLPLAGFRWPFEFDGRGLKAFRVARRLKGVCKDAKHLAERGSGHGFKNRLIIESGVGKAFNILCRDPGGMASKLQREVEQGPTFCVNAGRSLRIQRQAIVAFTHASHGVEQTFFLPSRYSTLRKYHGCNELQFDGNGVGQSLLYPEQIRHETVRIDEFGAGFEVVPGWGQWAHSRRDQVISEALPQSCGFEPRPQDT
ncbi:MAG: hypothetical protein WBQ64_09955 [Terriglobales bacterium]